MSLHGGWNGWCLVSAGHPSVEKAARAERLFPKFSQRVAENIRGVF